MLPNTAAPPPHDLKFAVIATDAVVLAIIQGALHVRLIDVRAPGYAGIKGLPGGLINPDETAEVAALRHQRTKGGIAHAYSEQLYTFSAVHRDKRSRVVSVAYLSLLPETEALAAETTDWGGVWVPVRRLPTLAYDHAEIVRLGLERLRAKITYSNIAHGLLPKTFTLTELQTCYEVVLGRALDKRNFRRKVLALGLVKETGETAMDGAHRPAALYRFATTKPMIMEVV